MFVLNDVIEVISRFIEAGGVVLWFIAILLFVMWTLFFERLWYYRGGLKKDISTALDQWASRKERQSWQAKQIRERLVSEISLAINQGLLLIKSLMVIAPLLGLLGTVTGMIDVFNVMAVTGGGDARSMAAGVSKATIPTMVGMVAALVGVFANTTIRRMANREIEWFKDQLTRDY